MDPIWIDNGAQLETFCRDIDDGPVAVDTESDHFHAYQARVCLIQLADGKREALIDPLALEESELAPLFELLEDPEIVKILHSARNDIIEIDRDYGVCIANLFDTQIAARFLAYERNSLTWMLEELLGVETGAEFKRFDWTTRPIPAEARRYAVDDVRYLASLRERFLAELEQQQWLEPFRQHCDYVIRSVEYESKEFDPGRWRKIKGSAKLDGRGRAALVALFLWRHRLCTELNRSAVTLFPNGALFRLAKERPSTADGVAAMSGLPRQLAADYAEEIAAVIAQSKDADPPPKRAPKKSYRSSPPEQKARYNALRQWRNEKANTLAIPSEFIATNATLSQIAAEPPQNAEELAEFGAILSWHVDTMGDEMLRILSNHA